MIENPFSIIVTENVKKKKSLDLSERCSMLLESANTNVDELLSDPGFKRLKDQAVKGVTPNSKQI